MTITVDAAELARGWLAVAVAQGNNRSTPVLYRTVCVEQHTHGLRLTSTDSYMVLTAWIPERDWELDEPAGLDEIPYATAVAIDEYGRAAGLLAHLRKLAKSDDPDTPKRINVEVRLNVPWQPDETAPSDMQLDGFAALAFTIEHPEHERVQLQVYEGDFPEVRRLIAGHKQQRPYVMALGTDVAGRLFKAARIHNGAPTVKCWFGGQDKPVAVAFGEDPEVSGLVMPVRWDFEANAPYASADPDGDTAGS